MVTEVLCDVTPRLVIPSHQERMGLVVQFPRDPGSHLIIAREGSSQQRRGNAFLDTFVVLVVPRGAFHTQVPQPLVVGPAGCKYLWHSGQPGTRRVGPVTTDQRGQFREVIVGRDTLTHCRVDRSD